MHYQPPRIVQSEAQTFVGVREAMSFSNNTTHQLWQRFMPRRSEVQQAIGMELYSIDLYPQGFFDRYDPTVRFQKWAAVKVDRHAPVPSHMETLEVPAGHYAVFNYRGKPSESGRFFQWVFNDWLPGSKFSLDDRPHFAVMGDRYKGEDPTSEEEIWIPIKS